MNDRYSTANDCRVKVTFPRIITMSVVCTASLQFTMHHEAQAPLGSRVADHLRLVETPNAAPEIWEKHKDNKIELQRLGAWDALLTERVSVST